MEILRYKLGPAKSTYLEALPAIIHTRLRDRARIGQEPSIENRNILGPYRSGGILRPILVSDTDGVDGAAPAVWW